MIWVIIIFFAFIYGGYSLGKSASFFISDDNQNSDSDITIINHNYNSETHNHLHITDRQLKELADNSKS